MIPAIRTSMLKTEVLLAIVMDNLKGREDEEVYWF